MKNNKNLSLLDRLAPLLQTLGAGEEAIWNDLAQLDPTDVCKRSLASYNAEANRYTLKILNEDYFIWPSKRLIEKSYSTESSPPKIKLPFRVMTVAYLVNAKDIEPSGVLVKPTQFKSGDVFFVGPHAMPVEPIKQKFGHNPEAFLRAGLLLGGKKVPHGDIAFELKVLPRIPLTFILWVGDEEFPPNASILFDSTAEYHMLPDALWAAVITATDKLLSLIDTG